MDDEDLRSGHRRDLGLLDTAGSQDAAGTMSGAAAAEGGNPMKRCIPYLLAFQQVLCGLWIMIVFVQAFLPGTLFLPGCVLFFILARCKTNYNFSMKQLGILNKKYYIQTMIYEMLML